MGCVCGERARTTADRTGTAAALRGGAPRARPGTRCPRGHRARADRVRQLPLRVDVRGAARRRAPHARRAAGRPRRRMDPARRLGVQRPVPRRPPDPDRLTLVRAPRGRGAVGRVPPVLRALPGATRADGAARRSPREPAAFRDRRDPARPGREPPAVALAAQLRPAVPRPSPRPIAAAPCRQRGRGPGRPRARGSRARDSWR